MPFFSPARLVGSALPLGLTFVLVFVIAGCGSDETTSGSPTVTATLTPTIEDGVQVFDVVGLTTLQFSATELVAAPGRIRIDFSVEEQSAPHNFVIPEIPDARTDILSSGASQSINFAAGERGAFQVICTLHPNMTATLKIV